MDKNLTEVTKTYIVARETAEAAEQAKKRAEVNLKEAFARAGIDANVVDGIKVAVNRKGRRTVDVGRLIDLVSRPLFKQVTKPTVDMKQFDAAVALGRITPEVAEAVTSSTEYDEVRLTVLAADEAVSGVVVAA